MDLQRLYGVAFSTLDGEVVTGHSVVRRRMLLMLIDAHRTRPDRSAAEIAWVQERLAPEVEMRLVWPSGARDQALAISFVDRRQMLLDARGDYRRLVSPTGKRVSVLVDPVLGRIEQVTADSPLFAIRHGMDGVDERGSDRTMDLGDVYR